MLKSVMLGKGKIRVDFKGRDMEVEVGFGLVEEMNKLLVDY